MQTHFARTGCALVCLSFLLFGSRSLRADVTGSILGVVRDKTQAAVTGAHVVATNVETNFTKEALSGPDGSYRFLALPAGNYRVTAEAAGFERFLAKDIDVKVNDQLRIDISLEVGSVRQQVSVEANAVQVETESTQLGDVIESKKMLALPLNGRSYIDLLGLQAGVARQPRESSQRSAGIGDAVRRQCFGKWPARNSQCVSGQWRGCQRRPQYGRRADPKSGLDRRVPADHE